MPINLAEQPTEYGKVLFQWDFPEFEAHERGTTWYVVAGLLMLGLLVYAIVSANILFAVIIVLVAILLVYIEKREPREMTIKIAEEGVVIENRLFPYEEIKTFWIAYEVPDVHNIYFEFKSLSIPRLSIPYAENINPNQLRSYLLQYVDENQEREGRPVSEVIAKLLKL